MKQRAKALIDIAHPNHREELERAAFERFHSYQFERTIY
jgi:acyl-CoA hydrolase